MAENKLSQLDNDNYKKNICQLIRQWHYNEKEPAKSVDVVLSVNGIPLASTARARTRPTRSSSTS